MGIYYEITITKLGRNGANRLNQYVTAQFKDEKKRGSAITESQLYERALEDVRTKQFRLELEKSGRWRQLPPFNPCWKVLLPYPTGVWKDHWGEIHIKDESKRHTYVILRAVDKDSGPAFCDPMGNDHWLMGGAQFTGQGQWVRRAKPLPSSGNPGLWVGLAGKGGGALGIGAEGVVAYVVPIYSPKSNGFAFIFYSGRLGVNAGASANTSIVLVSGVQEPGDLEGYVQTGVDWNLSLGGKLSAFKNVQAIGKLEGIANIIKMTQKNADSLATAAKTLYQGGSMDWEEKNVCVLDLPVGGGLEAGLYYYIGRCKIIKDWKKYVK